MEENKIVEIKEESKLKTFGEKVWKATKKHGKTVLVFAAGITLGILGSKLSSDHFADDYEEVDFVDEENSEVSSTEE